MLLVAMLLASAGCAAVRGASDFVVDAMNPTPGPPPLDAVEAASLDAGEIDRRLAFVMERLDGGRRHANLWQYGWLAVNAGGAAAGSFQAATSSSSDERAYGIVSATKATFGTAYLLLQPMPGRSGADAVRAMPSATTADRAAQLVAAEKLLYETAARSAQRTAWPMHAGNIAVNLAGGAVLLARGDAGRAALSFGVDATVGEVQLLTQPWQPRRDWVEYQAEVVAPEALTQRRPGPVWRVGAIPGGLALTLDF